MELSAVDPWGGPAAAATVGSAGPSPPPTVPAPAASGPWGTASTDPWGVASPTSPTSSDPWGGGAPPSVAPPPDPWGETSNRVNNVDPWGSSGEQLQHLSRMNSVANQVGGNGWVSKENRVLLCGWKRMWRPLDFYSSSPHCSISCLHNSPVTFSVMSPSCHISSSTHMLSVCNEESKHAESILPLCLNQGFLSSCFYSGLTVAVSQPELPRLLPLLCLFNVWGSFLWSLLYLHWTSDIK